MATVAGTIYLNGCNYQLQYDILSQSQANNTTTVRFYGVLNVTNGWISWDTSKKVWVHYAENRSFSNYFTRGSYTMVQGDYTFTHDANGNKTQNVGFGIDTSFVSGSSAVDITFPHIDRIAPINTFTGNNLNGNFSATYTSYSNNFNYKLRISIPNKEALAKYNNYTSGANVNLNVTSFEHSDQTALDRVKAYLNTKKINKVILGGVIETYNGNTWLGDSTEIKIECTFTDGQPTFTYTTTELNSKVSALLGTSANTIVKNASNVRVAVTPTAKYGASITKVIITHNNKSYEDTTSPYSTDIAVSANKFGIEVQDNRTNKATGSTTKTLLDYLPVSIDNLSFKRQTETSGIIILNLTATYFQQTFGSTVNAPIVKWKKDDGSWTTLTSSQYTTDNTNHKLTVSNLSLGDQVDYEHEATFYLSIEDKLSAVQNNRKVTIGIPTMELGKNDVKINGDLSFADNNNASILWKESGYGDKFRIIPDFNGFDDDNKLKIQGTVGGAGTDPTNFNDLISVTGLTGHVDISGATHSIRGFWSRPSGEVGTATSDSNSCLLIKRANNSEAPNNGVVLEYGNSANWRGQLYIGDNATQGIYYNGWSNGVRGTWRKLGDAPVNLYSNTSGTNGTVTLSETSDNFKYIEIYYAKQNKVAYSSVKVSTAIDMSKVSLITGYKEDTIFQVQFPTVKISGTSITKNQTGGINEPNTVFTGNEIYIYRVDGYR